jgi:transposase-like protein
MSKDGCKDSDKGRHTPILEEGSDTLQRLKIITGTGRRRRWTTDAKAAIVAESFPSGASASGLARHMTSARACCFFGPARQHGRRLRRAGMEACHSITGSTSSPNRLTVSP